MTGPTPRGSVVNPWGLFDAALAYLVGVVGSGLVAGAVGAGGDASIWPRFVATIPLWLAFIVTPLAVTRSRGEGPVRDLGLRVAPSDLWWVGVGACLQVVITAAYTLFTTREQLEAPSRALVDHAPGAGRLVLIVMTCLIAPVTEELFYRGLVMSALARRFAPWLAAAVTAVLFAASHFQLLQFPGLAVFGFVAGLAAQRSGRLGTAIATHVGFNGLAIALLLR